MRANVYIETIDELQTLSIDKIAAVIISPKAFSRFGRLTLGQAINVALEALRLNLKVIVEFDLFCHETERQSLFYSFKKFLCQLPQNSDISVKVCDLGVAQFCAKELPEINLHLNLETSFHNLHGLEALVENEDFKGRIAAVSLSLELPAPILKNMAKYLQEHQITSDYMIFGRILLFSTPRELLESQFEDILKKQDELLVEGQSEESPHRGFPILQNEKGTFMFNTKDLCLLDILQNFKDTQIDNATIDLRFEPAEKRTTFVKKILGLMDNFNDESFSIFKSEYGRPLTRGFFLTNKSDVLLPKLKNSRLQNRSSELIGQVVDVNKQANRLGILLRSFNQKLNFPIALRMVSPQGKDKTLVVHSFLNAKEEVVTNLSSQNIVFIPWISGITTRSNVFLESHPSETRHLFP